MYALCTLALPMMAQEISEECVINMSLFNESAKNKQFADAVAPWQQVYHDCPSANKAIYSQGTKIVEWQLSNAKDTTEYNHLRNLLMELHDNRIKYFGQDTKYPEAYVLGLKGVDYCTYFTEDPLKERAYEWLKQSVNGMGQKSQLAVLNKLVEVSCGLYKSNPKLYAEQFIADYQQVGDILSVIASNPNSKDAARALQYKDYADNLFAASGAADCAMLDKLYANLVTDNANNLEKLEKIILLYKKVGCTESDVYFAASESAHRLQPTEESAVGCARMCMKKSEWRQAIEYFQQALTLENADEEIAEDADKADYLYNIAFIYMDKLKNYMEARTFARLSLEAKPAQGRCYILIGCCYAASRPYSENDYPAAKCAIMNKTVFWVAVDKFIEAKRLDPSCTEDADKLIASYSKYFPTKEERFDLPNEFGQAFFIVGGWINEKTMCR